MKRFLTLLLILAMLISTLAVFAAAEDGEITSPDGTTGEPGTDGTENEPTDEPENDDTENDRLAVGSGIAALDGKSIIFVGCSYTYYGGCVIPVGANRDLDNFSIEDRRGDQGYFYQLCRANGAEVDVIDWTFGGHDLTDIFGGSCTHEEHPGYNHLDDLTERDFDYVVLQELLNPNFTTVDDYYNSFKSSIDIFRAVNPDAVFFINLQERVYVNYSAAYRECIRRLADEDGAIVINWGGLVHDVYSGNVDVPGATLPYYKNSFVVSRASDDGHHQNLLCGYLTALITYSLITGETAIDQPYDFIFEENPVSGRLDLDYFNSTYYQYDNPDTDFDESKSNFIDIFNSSADMLGLQTLADEYMNNNESWYNPTYTVTFKNTDGSVMSSATYHHGALIDIPSLDLVPEKVGDKYFHYVAAWNKEVSETCQGSVTYTAYYEKIANEFTVKFLDYDGSVISEVVYKFGSKVVIPVAPTREDDSEYTYTFTGWDSTVSDTCIGNRTYTAVYHSEPILPIPEPTEEVDNTPAVIGITVGSFALAALIVAAIVFEYRAVAKRREE